MIWRESISLGTTLQPSRSWTPATRLKREEDIYISVHLERGGLPERATAGHMHSKKCNKGRTDLDVHNP